MMEDHIYYLFKRGHESVEKNDKEKMDALLDVIGEKYTYEYHEEDDYHFYFYELE